MSRKGVITKRVKTVQTALSRISAQPRSPAGRGTNVHARPNLIRPSEVSAKVQNRSADQSRPGKLSPRSATPQPLTPHRARASRETSLAAAQLLAYHGRTPSEPGTPRVRPRDSSAKLIRPTTAADHEHPATTVPTYTTRHPADRPDRPSQRRGRPEARFEARFIFSSPA
ncbi:unnamed protein product [Microthlaspi erraticum]|uniref:Uncharacterized protein n=1 Tax=Microthlaspi erraticum TaxID=1685480 RepID=A0A6D2HHY0_9BRAS|nr:unnamed protein product [Microthlaspi erraticum]